VGDVREAFRLLEVAMQQSATDHATGKLNMLYPPYVMHFFFLGTPICSADFFLTGVCLYIF
jgi:hypothetical protein